MAPNIIEIVKRNGVALTPDSQKAVNVEVPTATSDLTNDGDGDSAFATESYVDTNGGKIDVIKVNGAAQPITNKEVDLSIPRVTHSEISAGHEATIYVDSTTSAAKFSDTSEGIDVQLGSFPVHLLSKATIAATYQTETQVQELIDASLSGITGIDFQIVDKLPATGEHGVIYLLPNEASASDLYDEYIWITPAGGTAHYEQIGTTAVDLTGYWSKEEMVAITTAEIDALFA